MSLSSCEPLSSSSPLDSTLFPLRFPLLFRLDFNFAFVASSAFLNAISTASVDATGVPFKTKRFLHAHSLRRPLISLTSRSSSWVRVRFTWHCSAIPLNQHTWVLNGVLMLVLEISARKASFIACRDPGTGGELSEKNGTGVIGQALVYQVVPGLSRSAS
jgi:hypothetical protein